MEIKRSDQRLSKIELEIMKEIDELKDDGMSLAGGFFNRDSDALLGRVIRELIMAEPERNLQLTHVIHPGISPSRPIGIVEFSYLRFDGDSILEAGLKALKYYLEKKERG